MALLTLASKYNQWPSLASGESKALDSSGNEIRGDYYKYLPGTSTANTYAIRVEWYVAKKGSTYYKIYFKLYLCIKVGWSMNFSGDYTLKLNSNSVSSSVSFSTGGLLQPTSSNCTNKPNGTSSNFGYYYIGQPTFTMNSSTYKSTIGLNGTGYNISNIALTVNFNGTKLSGKTFNNVSASTASHDNATDVLPQRLPAIVTATAASIVGLSATGGHKQLSVLWSTNIAVDANVQYSINNGSSWTTVSGSSGSANGAFAISGLNPGQTYTVTLKVSHDGLTTTKSTTGTPYAQPSISLSSTSVKIGIGDSSKSISISVTNPNSNYYLRARAFLTNGTAISSLTNVSVGSNTISLSVSTIKSNVSDSDSFYVRLYSYMDSSYNNTAYSAVDTGYGTITIDYSASDITFDDSDFVLTSSTANYSVSTGTLGNRLLIRSESVVYVKLNNLATTSAGSLTYTVEIRNSSDNVVKSTTLTNTNSVNLGVISAAGTYTAVLTIYNETYNKSKVVTIYNIYVSEYSKPSVFGTVVKTSTSGTLQMTVSAQYSTIKNINGSNVNAIRSFTYCYRTSSSSSWSSATSISTSGFSLNGNLYQLNNLTQNISGFSSSYNYEFRFTITDYLNTVTYDLNAAEAGAIIRILENGQVGIGASPDTTSSNILTVGGDALIQGTASAKSHANVSLAELKTDIIPFEKNVEDIILGTDVYNYKYKDDVENGNDIERIGFIIGDDYNTYEGIINENHNAIDLYSCIGILWKSQQKVYEELKKIKEQLSSN